MGNTMTAPRFPRKPRLWGTALLSAAAVWLGPGPGGPGGATSAEWIVVDPTSGLAISGFDPVAYFTDGAPLQGKGELEQAFAGAVWRFRSDGNRAAFVADPEVYMPRFGGYDPVDLARGVAVAGNPRLWLISEQRLYFFYAAETQQEFVNDRDRVLATADGEWTRLRQKLTP
jgi:hypothetical protein